MAPWNKQPHEKSKQLRSLLDHSWPIKSCRTLIPWRAASYSAFTDVGRGPARAAPNDVRKKVQNFYDFKFANKDGNKDVIAELPVPPSPCPPVDAVV